jgi:cytochrome c556
VLEGIAVEDFALVGRHAESMAVLSRAAAWQVLQTPEYLRHSAEFEQASQKLVQSARDKNLDGATLAYVQMALSCVNCHKHVRSVKMAALEPPAAAAPKEVDGT